MELPHQIVVGHARGRQPRAQLPQHVFEDQSDLAMLRNADPREGLEEGLRLLVVVYFSDEGSFPDPAHPPHRDDLVLFLIGHVGHELLQLLPLPHEHVFGFEGKRPPPPSLAVVVGSIIGGGGAAAFPLDDASYAVIPHALVDSRHLGSDFCDLIGYLNFDRFHLLPD